MSRKNNSDQRFDEWEAEWRGQGVFRWVGHIVHNLDHGHHQAEHLPPYHTWPWTAPEHRKGRGPLSLAPPSVRPYLDPYTQNQSPASSPSSVIVAIISLEGRGGFQKNPWSDDATQTGCLKEFIQTIDWASGIFYSSDVEQLNYFFNIWPLEMQPQRI